ncbi:hypothetical protein [Helicobacter bilis]|uniref:hypothetical protein n=1 Tax=Helicobacter bilis TaxID=37372 RepID=UPI00248F22CD|nr:hypothetical protein [Helicobacter bilis]
MKKGLIALVLSAFISNAYAVEVSGDELEFFDSNGDVPHYSSDIVAACHKIFSNKFDPSFFNNIRLNFVPSDNYLKEWSMRDELKYIEKFEYMKNAEALASAVKKDLEALDEKLKTEINASAEKFAKFQKALIMDACVRREKCEFNGSWIVSCDIKKPVDEILNNLDKYYTDIK